MIQPKDQRITKMLDLLEQFQLFSADEMTLLEEYLSGSVKEEEIEKRSRVEEAYRQRLTGTPGLELKAIQPEVRPNYAYFPVLFDETAFGASRDQVWAALKDRVILARKYFYPLTSAFPCYQGRFDPEVETPVALCASRRVLCLPMYGDLALETVERICGAVLDCRK